jgi:TMEM151 family
MTFTLLSKICPLFGGRLVDALLFSLLVIVSSGSSWASDPSPSLKSVSALDPISSHSTFRPVNSQYGVLASSEGNIQIVEFPQDLHQAVVFGRKSNGQRPASHIKASVLTLTVVGLLARNLIVNVSTGSWGLFAFALILYFFEAFFSSTRRYLSNMSEPSMVLDKVANLTKQPPIARWDLECYHYQRRYRASRQDRSHESQKVITYRARHFFSFKDWKDITSIKELVQSLEYDPLKPFVKVTFIKLMAFADEATHQNYLDQQAFFYAREGNRDIFMDTSTSLDITGFLPKMLAVRSILNAPTGKFRMSWYWVFTGLLLTVPYRMWFASQCDEIAVVIAKEVQI